MKDETYFNDKMFLHTNTELKKVLKNLSQINNSKMYLIIDEAIRYYVQKQGKEFLLKPKKVMLVEDDND
jgi:geranylgeranyl pyrophosphate synthase